MSAYVCKDVSLINLITHKAFGALVSLPLPQVFRLQVCLYTGAVLRCLSFGGLQ